MGQFACKELALDSAPIAWLKPLLVCGFSAGLHVAYLSCALLVRGAPGKDGGFAECAFDLSERMRRLRIVLYLGSGVVTIGIVRMFCFHQVLMASIDSGNLRAISDAVVLFFAGYYTVMIMAVYVPAAMVLYGRASALAAGANQTQREQLKSDSGPLALRTDLLPGLVAIMAPVIAGVLSVTVKPLLSTAGG